VPGGAGGFIAAGIVTKKMSLSARQQIRGMFLMALVGLLALLAFCVQCDSAQLADTTRHQRAEHVTDRLVSATVCLITTVVRLPCDRR